MSKTLLIVDDDRKLRELLKEYLEGYGYLVVAWPQGNGVLGAIIEHQPDLVVLDIMLPGKSGLEVLGEIRQRTPVPVIMLTAKGEDADRIVGLELVADDYLPKPFNPRELLARARAVLRRLQALKQSPGDEEDLKAGGLFLDSARRMLHAGEAEVLLSATEYKMMSLLMSRPDVVFTRDQLMNAARGRDAEAFERSVDVHISNLRAKLKPYGQITGRIKTVWGTGYMFVSQP